MHLKILETERLVLETLEDAHFDALAALLANEKVHRFFPKVLSREESQEFLQEVQKRQRQDGTSFWGVIHKEDQRFLGICGLLKQTIDGIEETEVGYRIADEFWGKGYGTEAAAGCMRYAKDVLKLPSIISLILKENRPSIRVAEKNGLALEKETLFYDRVHQVYRKHF
jgi:[ribosomal protein S5]-alanine N-acetyltransferase